MFRGKMERAVLSALVGAALLNGCKSADDDMTGGTCKAMNTPIDESDTAVCVAPPHLSENFGAQGQCNDRPFTDYDHELAVTHERRASLLPQGAPLWPACSVTDNREDWVLVGESAPGSGPRATAFDQIRSLLDYTKVEAPSNQAFQEARDIYAVDQGVQSRVNRRPDYHFAKFPLPIAPDASGQPNAVCQAAIVPRSCVDACPGPLQLRDKVINPAFCTGETSTSDGERRIQAARIEAGILWFFYLSIYSEAHTTRGSSTEDTDSALAYYTGYSAGITPATTTGLSSYIKALDAETHERVWEGLRALRCWRSLEGDQKADVGAVGTTDADLRWRYATNQLDRAVLHGVTLIIKDRLEKFRTESNADIKVAHWAFLQVIGPSLVRGARAADPETDGASKIESEFAKTVTQEVDAEGLIDAISQEFPCP